jgi:hypothetical protein
VPPCSTARRALAHGLKLCGDLLQCAPGAAALMPATSRISLSSPCLRRGARSSSVASPLPSAHTSPQRPSTLTAATAAQPSIQYSPDLRGFLPPSTHRAGKFEFDVEVSLGTRPPGPDLGVSASARRPARQRSHAGHDAPGGTGCARPACRTPPLPGDLLASWIAALRAAQFSRAKRPFSGAIAV